VNSSLSKEPQPDRKFLHPLQRARGGKDHAPQLKQNLGYLNADFLVFDVPQASQSQLRYQRRSTYNYCMPTVCLMALHNDTPSPLPSTIPTPRYSKSGSTRTHATACLVAECRQSRHCCSHTHRQSQGFGDRLVSPLGLLCTLWLLFLRCSFDPFLSEWCEIRLVWVDFGEYMALMISKGKLREEFRRIITKVDRKGFQAHDR
jgi:hypothetical protein